MDMNDQVYIKLQRHLNSQPIGFPATKSGSEIRILKHIFSPREAEIVTCLSYGFEPLETIFKRGTPFKIFKSKNQWMPALHDGLIRFCH